MSITSSDIDALDRAISSGVLMVKHSDGKEIRYRSINDLIKARDVAVNLLSGRRGYRKRTLQASVDSNLGSYATDDNYSRHGF